MNPIRRSKRIRDLGKLNIVGIVPLSPFLYKGIKLMKNLASDDSQGPSSSSGRSTRGRPPKEPKRYEEINYDLLVETGKILKEHIGTKNRQDSELYFQPIFSVQIRARFKVTTIFF